MVSIRGSDEVVVVVRSSWRGHPWLNAQQDLCEEKKRAIPDDNNNNQVVNDVNARVVEPVRPES